MSVDQVITSTDTEEDIGFGDDEETPVLLFAHTKEGATLVDRCLVTEDFTIGRDDESDLQIHDEKISKQHVKITYSNEQYWVADLGSTNHTYLNGDLLITERPLEDGSIIRLGQAVLVFRRNARYTIDPPPINSFDFIGPFHASKILDDIKEAAISARHILLAGPSGSGKELAAKAVATISAKSIRSHNAARYTSPDEAASTLFGIAPNTFSGVNERPGLIEQSQDGTLFLDEVHNLPERIQRSLLRIIEDGYMERIGETEGRYVNIQFVFASNAPAPTYSLAADFLARLRVVQIPPLKERIADIPAIFKHLIDTIFQSHTLDSEEIFSILGADHYESLCLDAFPKDNVRGLKNIADRIATRIKSGTSVKEATKSVFRDYYADGPVDSRRGVRFGSRSSYPSMPVSSKALTVAEVTPEEAAAIVQAHEECGGNISAMDKRLRGQKVKFSRRRLTKLVDILGLPRIRKRGK